MRHGKWPGQAKAACELTSLLVMVPVRNRPEKIPGLIESYEKNTTRDDTELMFISDGDDDSYQDTDSDRNRNQNPHANFDLHKNPE